MAALLEAELPESRTRGRIFAAFAALLVLAGIGMTCAGIFGASDDANAAAALAGGGAVATLFGVSMVSPKLVRPLASICGWPLERLRGLTGRLARENAVRKPGRTAVTAGALMIGLAVVVFVTVFAAGISASVGNAIDRNFQGDLVLQNTDGYSPISPGAAREAAKARGVKTVSSLSFAGGEVGGKQVRVSAVDPKNVSDVLSLDWEKGSPATLSSLSDREAVLDDAWAKQNDIGVGDRVTVLTPLERHVAYTVTGTVKDNADLLGNLVVTEDQLRREFGVRSPSLTFVKLEPGADADRVQESIKKAVKARFGTVDTLNQQELKDSQEEQINQLVAFFYVLLALAVVISLLGIVTTLALSIHERTRELGMLRAVGMSRRQVRRLIRYESVITALIGAILGTVLGVIFAALVSRPLATRASSSPIRSARCSCCCSWPHWPACSRRSGRRGARQSSTCSRRWRTSSGRGAGRVPRMGSPMSPTDRTAAELTERLLEGDKRALARAISLVENDDPEGWALVREVYPRTGKAAVTGFTGPPGVGKSTLIGRLVENARGRDREVAVLSIDPSSPFTHGALLGDRIRLSDHFLDPGVFIRSMASRGSLGGLSEATLQAALLMDASGKDDVFLETVGVGQAEVDIIDHADTIVLVLMPGSGDSIQALKAGVMEIPDVIVINKCDHPLTDTMVREIRGVLSLGPQEGWRVPILKTEASRGEGDRGAGGEDRRAPRVHRRAGHPGRAPPAQPDERGARPRRRRACGGGSRSRCARTTRCRSCSTRWWRGGSTRPRPRRASSSATSRSVRA